MTSCSSAASSTVRVTGPAWSRRVGQRDEAVAGHPAVRRLDADRAGDGAGLADRAAGVGADRERGLEGRDRGRGAAAGAAGDPVEVPRVARRAVRRVLGGGAHRELVHVGLAEDRQAGGPRGCATTVASYGGTQPSRIREPHVVGRPSVASTSLTAIGTPSSGEAARPGRAAGVGLGGLGQRALGVDVQEGVHGGVDRGDPVEVRPG